MRDWAGEVRARLAADPDAPSLPREVIEEVAQHIGDLHRHALVQGRSIEEADALVDEELSKVRQLSNAVTERPRFRPPPDSSSRVGAGLSRDLAHAWRQLQTRRGYFTVVVLTLALGIGACTAVFSLFNAMLLGPLPYPSADALVLLWETEADNRDAQFIVSAPNYLDWTRETRSFAALGIWEPLTFNVSATADPEQLPGVRASASLFDVLAVAPALGRTFTAAEDEQTHRVAVISDALWRVHFAADAAVIGRPVRLNGEVYEVIGVMPRGFEFPQTRTGAWIPMSFTRRDKERGSHSFLVAGRLREGVTFEQARDEVERLGAAMQTKYRENVDEGATVQPMAEYGMRNANRILVALSGAVALVLLIACVNVASLQFASGLSRRREFVTRLALGATHRHLIRQVLVEALLVAAIGALGGIAIAWGVTRIVDVLLPPGFRDLPFRGEVAVAVDSRVLLFALVTAALSAVLFAFAPLAGVSRRSLQSMLRDGERGATPLASRARRALVAAEIALALVVLSGAGLMVRSLSALLQVQPGLDPRNVLTMRVSLPQRDTYGSPERTSFCADLQREVGSLPGVVRLSATSHLPLSGSNAGRGITIEGRPQPAPGEGAAASYRLVCPGYFSTLGIPLISGRDFTHDDRPDSEPVVIINRASARRYWPGGDPVGQRIKIGGYDSTNPWMTIVGVVDDVRHFALEADVAREMFRPYSQAVWPVMTVVAKTAGEPLIFERAVRDQLKRVELNLPAANARSMETVVRSSVAWRVTPMRLLAGFAVVGLLLAGIGVYGVLAYYVSQRRREFGVRVALGASRSVLIGLVLRQSAAPLGLGIAAGIAGSLAAGRFLMDLLYEVRPGDPLVLVTISALLLAVTLVSSIIPARRAAHVDPLLALREE
jgi:putative ABC transport system permease protein